ncbi:MAG: STAS domain-containing protein [Pseudomonadota bacterium]
MPFSLIRDAGKNSLILQGQIGISEGSELRESLKEFIQSEQAEIDMGEVTDIDVSALQLLIAARKSAGRDGKTIHVTSVSGSCRETFKLAGAAALLGLTTD